MLIMPSNKLKSNLNNSFLVLILIVFTACGSFNSSSLVSADGIYSNGNKSETQNSSSKYYENYFKEKALEMGNDFVFSEDGATAKYKQNVYSFWITSVTKQYIDAWKKQMQLLKNKKKSFVSIKNDMLWYHILQPAYLLLILVVFSKEVVLFALISGVISFLFLECINYIEHYGLKRFKTSTGRYERVQAHHSWNSNHNIGRIVLYELTRHSDHHFKASKKYQILDCHDEAPQLPYGYPASILLSLVPPLWFYIVNPLVPEKMKV